MEALDASRLTQEAYREARASADAIVTGMGATSAAVYAQAVQRAASRVNVVGERAMAEAVQWMASQGVHAYTYTRRDGTLVRVPADVGIRRAVRTAGRRRMNESVLDAARSLGRDLVEVNRTASCRPTHRAIDGKVFSLTGSTPGYPVLDDALMALFSEPNCGHSCRIYDPASGPLQPDPLEGTGYSPDEARAAISKQRRLENEVRKRKRTVEALKAADLPTTEANARLRAAQARLREHVEANAAVCRRERHREQIYDSARRMKNARKRGGGTVPPVPVAGGTARRVAVTVRDGARMGLARVRDALSRIARELRGAGSGMRVESPLVKSPGSKGGFKVSGAVNSKAFHDAFENSGLAKPVRESLYREAGKILERADGTENEFMSAVDARTGAVVADNLGRDPKKRRATSFNSSEMRKVRANPNKVVTLHCHPDDKPPSYTDAMTALMAKEVEASMVVSFAGSVWIVRGGDESSARRLEELYNELKGDYGDYAEVIATERLEKEGSHGFRIERLS